MIKLIFYNSFNGQIGIINFLSTKLTRINASNTILRFYFPHVKSSLFPAGRAAAHALAVVASAKVHFLRPKPSLSPSSSKIPQKLSSKKCDLVNLRLLLHSRTTLSGSKLESFVAPNLTRVISTFLYEIASAPLSF